MNCGQFSEKRFKCHSIYGKRGEDCLNEELSEKRCLSLQHCIKEAKEYYGNSVKMDLSVLDEDGQAPSYRSAVRYVPNSKAQELWAVGIPGISYSNDGGESWQDISSASFYTIRIVENSRTAWLAGKNKVAKMVW